MLNGHKKSNFFKIAVWGSYSMNRNYGGLTYKTLLKEKGLFSISSKIYGWGPIDPLVPTALKSSITWVSRYTMIFRPVKNGWQWAISLFFIKWVKWKRRVSSVHRLLTESKFGNEFLNRMVYKNLVPAIFFVFKEVDKCKTM